LFAITGAKSNCDRGSIPYIPKNGETPVVSEAWLFVANSASGN
jgi:hypothetical protein